MTTRRNTNSSKLENITKSGRKISEQKPYSNKKEIFETIGGLAIYVAVGLGAYALSNKIDSMIYSPKNSSQVTSSPNYQSDNNSKTYNDNKHIIANLPFP